MAREDHFVHIFLQKADSPTSICLIFQHALDQRVANGHELGRWSIRTILEPIRFRREIWGVFLGFVWGSVNVWLWQRTGFCSAVFPVLINLRHDAAAPSSHFWDGLGSLGSPLWTMAGKWVLTSLAVDCMRISYMFIRRFCLFFDSQMRFSAFWVIVLQKFISIKLSVLSCYPQYSPRFRWFCSGALLGFSRCFTTFF